MQDLIKYVMGIAAKSNIEKRQVGCIIVNDQEKIVAEGYNEVALTSTNGTTELHAELVACRNMCENALNIKDAWYTAYVTYPPCPACAKMLTEYNVKEVIVVEAFMKFDGDKLRLDLVDGELAIKLMDNIDSWDTTVNDDKLKHHLFDIAKWGKSGNKGFVCPIEGALKELCCVYDDYLNFEECLARVLTFGARKYKANNWKKCTDTGRYLAAAHRHLNALLRGEALDSETGLSHYDHIACNLMFLYVLGLKY